MAITNAAFDIGDTIRVTGTFKAGTYTVTSGVPSMAYALTDPTTITLSVVSPSAVTTSYTYAGGTVTKSTTGVFYRDLTPDASGEWRCKWTSTGAVAAVDEFVLYVRDAQVG